METYKNSISIVIPTYNRNERLSDVLRYIFASETDGSDIIEVIVVDDGSKIPARNAVAALQPPEQFSLKYIFQENAGPAAARNNGFRSARNAIVLFIDDDILIPPGLLREHIKAHNELPHSVIVGPCPCKMPPVLRPSSRFVKRLEDADMAKIPDEGYLRVSSVISGNLSIERDMFVETGGLYNETLNSPTAEEFDIIARLKREQIAVYVSKAMTATHLQPTEIKDTCLREYKHAVGVGELGVKDPQLAEELPDLKYFLSVNGRILAVDALSLKFKKVSKSLLSTFPFRKAIEETVSFMERIVPADKALEPLFKLAIGLNIYAGIREGKRKFAK